MAKLNIHWCSIGDFHTIICSHEQRGTTNPSRLPMDVLFSLSDKNNLFHIPTRGVQFTWSNGMEGARLLREG
jgi:hypothetical protein